MTKVAFGLDLSGFSKGNTGLARGESEGDRICIAIMTDHLFDRPIGGDTLLDEVQEEVRFVESCTREGDIVVDVPINLQGLPSLMCPAFVWELTKRPVDYAFGALPPLADRLGAPFARFHRILSLVQSGTHRVLETYPAASQELLSADRETLLGLHTRDHDFNEHELDAAICALTGVIDDNSKLSGDDLEEEVRRRIEARLPREHHHLLRASVPRNYVLLRNRPQNICIQRGA